MIYQYHTREKKEKLVKDSSSLCHTTPSPLETVDQNGFNITLKGFMMTSKEVTFRKNNDLKSKSNKILFYI